ncbi:unnamed protein product [Bursaphelenchus xylophilus]|uniref:BLOC-1-related complex subunit 7 n=1 Tax=Bursaphelenchus xylophilus TaxID=6326 RepID=A0A1I7RQM4_BURXY|nr:unnamed protein product [Bursaphelenchus xylophilus]CAG9104828.1 unnamed protein product [Bursaphelenchus xylophilus]
MQVVPMGTMDHTTTSTKTTNAQVVKMVQLEGKTRLPQRIQEAVVDIGALMMSAQQSGPNGETTTLHQAIRSTAGTESVLNNTAYSLKRLETAVEKASHRNALIERR